MSQRTRLSAFAIAGCTGVAVASIVGSNGRVVDLIVLSTALVVADVIELRPANRSALPFGLAIVLVLLRAATMREFVAIVVSASLAAAALRHEPNGIWARTIKSIEYLTQGLAAGAAYRLISDATHNADSRAMVLSALAGAAVAEILVADLAALVREHRLARLRPRGADLALISSGMLMAVGYGGIGGRGRLGLWGPLLFSIPLFAAWYSFELLRRTRRTFHQTVRALGVAPELGGLARAGHVERVAVLAVALGAELGITEAELDDLETAAWLHHLGAVCLDDPVDGRQLDAAEVASAGAQMLRTSHALANAGDIVAAEPGLHRPPDGRAEHPSALMGQILKVASAYDELTEGNDTHATWAVEALFTGPAYVYDGRVLTALERVLSRRGLIAS